VRSIIENCKMLFGNTFWQMREQTQNMIDRETGQSGRRRDSVLQVLTSLPVDFHLPSHNESNSCNIIYHSQYIQYIFILSNRYSKWLNRRLSNVRIRTSVTMFISFGSNKGLLLFLLHPILIPSSIVVLSWQ
jgi:hypothetical protein